MYAVVKILKSMKESNDENAYGFTRGSVTRLKIDDDSRAVSPVTPTSEVSYTYMSPVSDRSSSGSSTSKKRRSYDKTYRTHEPLKGLPEVEFEEKQWDLDDTPSPTSEYEPDNKPTYNESQQVHSPENNNEYSVPFDNYNKRRTYVESEPQINKTDEIKSASNPNLLDSRYTLPNYATVNKDRKRIQSQSSIITDV